jgi:hypothetical protein
LEEKSSNTLINFQLNESSIRQKSDYEWGKKIAQDIESKVTGGLASYFFRRNARWKINRNYANGKIDMSRFQDMLEFNGKQNYININWQCIHIVNRIVSGLVGRWMQTRKEKISVTATDSLSTREKQDEYDKLEFIIDNRRKLEELQAQIGEQLIPQDEGLPEDKEQLRLWQSQFQRLPEEILYQLGINSCLSANGWFDVLKEKMLHDAAETGFVATCTTMSREGVIHIEWLKPENCFYSYSNFPDFRDTSWRGCMRTMKISELRKKYSKEFHPNNTHALDEEQLYNLAATAKEYQLYDNITWRTEWNYALLRPYDEWNIDVMEFELKTVDTESYTVVTTKKNKSTIIKKGRPAKKADNEEVMDDSRINIYRGVYSKQTQVMLEWGLKKNMIRPHDPKEIGNAEFSYSFYMVQNYDMTCLAIPEKIQEPADQMIIARLKMQQLVAKMRPAGAAINWDALQNIDYGLGDGNKTIDVKKMYDQTGDLYWRGRDAEGNSIPIPIQELQNSGFLGQLQGLVMLYDKHYQIMKDELGEDPNLISQALQPRVTAGNVEASQQSAEYATDYFYNAYSNCMNDTAKKVSCLLKDSVTYGAQAYRNIINENDIDGREFSTKIQLLPTDIQIAKFEALMNQAMVNAPELALFIDPFQLMRIAGEDVKMAEALFRQGTKKMLIWKQQTAQQNQDANYKAQVESARVGEQEKRETMKEELRTKGITELMISKEKQKEIVLQGLFGIYQKGLPIPAQLQEVEADMIKNVGIPLFSENMDNITQMVNEAIAEDEQEEGMEQQEQMQMQQ